MKFFNFSKQTILITGSSSGIGYTIAKNFIDCNGKVIINSRNNKNLIKAKNKLGAYDFIKSDLSKSKGRENLVNEIKKRNFKLDVLVCNVGMSSPPLKGLRFIDSWRDSLESNFLSTAHLISLFSDNILKKNSSIVCISSICSIKNLGCPITYATSKAALNSFVEQQAIKLAGMNIRINSVVPGNILFDGSVWQKKIIANKNNVKNMIKKNVPMKRFGTPEEVANSVLFLASNFSSFTTGSKIIVDGGQTL